MSKHTLIALLGFFIALVPFLGFPGGFKTFLIVVSALVISYTALTIIARRRRGDDSKNTASNTQQHSPGVDGVRAEAHHE